MEKITSGRSMILQRMSRHGARRNVASWSPFTSDCLWVSSWFTKDDEDFNRMAMNKSFPRTQDMIQSVRRQVKTLIDR